MKKLLVNAGIAAATSVAFTALVPAQEAQALVLESTYQTTLTNGVVIVGDAPTVRVSSPGTGLVEVGEFSLNESRGFVGFDLAPLLALEENERSSLTLNFNVADFTGGLGTGGLGDGSNADNRFEGVLQLSRNILGDGSTAPAPLGLPGFGPDQLLFDPFLTAGFPDGGLGVPFEFSASSIGDSVSLDVTSIVTELLDTGNPMNYSLALVLKGDFEGGTPGSCGGFVGTERDVCSGIVFDDFTIKAVPTPAAILPALLGMGSAAVRKKKEDEESDDA
ncbi:hypothetical protein Lepto7376_2775 [[Leptolyngbya] sp. PCC 7376]|uniref:PTPA-CTERM sorting domain-containing protein n=1 Tax=[Leptolyngbya] sp. PCC 7376 TaxID=111781 RepID=UPI00029F35A7|nr:PTPA-CTERM sorting domain-containing protein [[Leptolyngbya] sp. PCC 7376]AFY39032.1 hypothetical protein Lepto7376_2775 [[Leptolyngbya] sp. PCC 7376]